MTISPPSPARPPSVRIALASVFVGVVVHLVVLVWAFVWQAIQHRPVIPPRAAAPIAVIVWTLVICALGIFFALRMRTGSDGARVILTVFAALELLVTVAGLVWFVARGYGGSTTGVVTLVAWALVAASDVTFLVTAFRRSAEDFFARRPV